MQRRVTGHLCENLRMDSRGRILQNIKLALKSKSHVSNDAANFDETIRAQLAAQTPKSDEGLLDQFKSELEMVSGEMMSAETIQEAASHIKRILEETKVSTISISSSELVEKVVAHSQNISIVKAETLEQDRASTLAQISTSIVDIEYAIADSATLVVPFNKIKSTFPHFLPDCVIALVHREQIIANHFELFEKMDNNSIKNMLLITGPSRTADIEKILILGAHGPRRLIVIVIHEKQ